MVRLDSSGPTENLTTRIHTVCVPVYAFLLPAGEPFPAMAWIVSRTLLLRATKTRHQNLSKCAWIPQWSLCVISILYMESMKGKLERLKFPMRTFFTEGCSVWDLETSSDETTDCRKWTLSICEQQSRNDAINCSIIHPQPRCCDEIMCKICMCAIKTLWRFLSARKGLKWLVRIHIKTGPKVLRFLCKAQHTWAPNETVVSAGYFNRVGLVGTGEKISDVPSLNCAI